MRSKALHITRRELLTGFGATALGASFGCSSSEKRATGTGGRGGAAGSRARDASTGSGGKGGMDAGSMSTGGANAATGGRGVANAGRGGNAGTNAGSGGVSGGTAAQGGADGGASTQGVPSYMKGMADFEVRNLPSATGGFATMYAALPSEWKQTGQPNGADNVFLAWSGGAADVAGRRLFVHGGGHNDSSNNGLYVYDFSGDTAPVGWSVAPNSLSALSAVTPATNTYSDGKPTSIHSYNQLWFDPNRNRLYRFGGSGFSPGGGGIPACFYYDFAASAWVPFFTDAGIGATLGSSLVGSPDGSELLYLASNKTPLFVAASNAALTPYGDALTGSEESDYVLAMDTKRSDVMAGACRYAAFYHDPAGPRVKLVTVDWKARTFSVETRPLGGADAGDLESAGPCVAYDAERDSFWVFANATELDDGVLSSIYEVDASTFEVTKTALKTPIQGLVNGRGGYNRQIWFSDWRIIGTVHAHDQPMSIIKVP